jgi:hypothetical protein
MHYCSYNRSTEHGVCVLNPCFYGIPCARGLVLVGQRLALRASARPYGMHVTIKGARAQQGGAKVVFLTIIWLKVGFLTTFSKLNVI